MLGKGVKPVCVIGDDAPVAWKLIGNPVKIYPVIALPPELPAVKDAVAVVPPVVHDIDTDCGF